MKFLTKILILLTLIALSLFPQEAPGGNEEIYTWTYNVSSNDTIYFQLTNISPVWNENFEIATQHYYNGQYYTIENPLEIVVGEDQNFRKGFDHVDALAGIIKPPFCGYALYKISVRKNFFGTPINFYINFLDEDWGTYCAFDIYLYYYGSSHYLEIDWGSTCDTITVSDDAYYTIWEGKNKQSNPTTYAFNDFWQNCLVRIGNYNNHPRIVWGSHPTFVATNYKVYRAESTTYVDPQYLTFHLIATTGSSTFEYVDTDIDFGEINSHWLYYYIKAYHYRHETYSDASNTLELSGIYSPEKENSNKVKKKNQYYSLSQNYPNPGNPSTTISYSIAQDGFVNLTVYDILGREVAKLVNEEKPPGEYEVTFNAEGLPSGVYFYGVTAGNFNETRKMILLR